MTRPTNWPQRPLSEVVAFNPRHKRELPDDLEVSFVPMPAVSERRKDLLPHHARKLGEIRRGYTHFQDGDVLFAKITPCMENGKAAVARDLFNGLGCGTTELHVMRSNGSVLPEWIYYFVWQEPLRKAAEHRMTGAVGQERVPLSFLEEQIIPVPDSIGEQRRIIEKLDHVVQQLDDSKTRLERIPPMLKRLRACILATACSGRLTAKWRKGNLHPAVQNGIPVEEELELPELPPSWRYARLATLLVGMKYGTSKRCGYERKGRPVLRIPNIGDGELRADDIKYGELPDGEYRELALEPGDLLLIRSNGSVSLLGKTALVSRKFRGFAYAGYLIRLRPHREHALPEYLNHALGAPQVRRQIEMPARSTSGVHNINSNEVGNLLIPLPPPDEQREIVRRVTALVKQSQAIQLRYERAKSFTGKIAGSVIAKAYRGELSAAKVPS